MLYHLLTIYALLEREKKMPTNTQLVTQAGALGFWFDPSDTATIVPAGSVTRQVTSNTSLYYWLNQTYPQNFEFDSTNKTITYAQTAHYVDKVNGSPLFFKTAGSISDYFIGSGAFEKDLSTFVIPGILAQKGYVYTLGNPTAPGPVILDSATPGNFTYLGVHARRTDWTAGNVTWLFANKNTVTNQTPLDNDAREYFPDTASATAGAYLTQTNLNNFVLKLTSSDGNILSNGVNVISFRPFSVNTVDFVLGLRAYTNAGVTTLKLYINGVLNQTLTAVFDGNGNISVSDERAAILLAGQPFTITDYALSSLGNGSISFNNGIGSMGEVLIYANALTEQNFTSVNNYLQTKWSLAAPAVVFGSLSTSVATAGASFVTSLQIANAVSATLTTVAANIGSNWTITNLNDGNGTWRIAGTAPSVQTRFSFIITATNLDGTSVVTTTYPVVVTQSGSLSIGQNLILNTPGVSLWIDPSDQSTLRQNQSGAYNYVFDKVNGYGWTMQSSETISKDTSTFSSNGIAFSSVKYNSGFNTGIILDKTTCPDLVALPNFRGVPVADSSGHSTLIMVVGYGANRISVPDAAFYAIASDGFTTSDQSLYGAWGVDTKNVGADPLSVLFVDNESASQTKPYRHYLVDLVIPVGGRAIVVWRYGPDGLSIRLNGQEVTVDYVTENGNQYTSNSPGIKPEFTQPRSIGILGSPQGYTVGSIGDVIGVSGYLPDVSIVALENYLQNKWLSNTFSIPTITTSSSLQQYVNSVFSAVLSISNGSNHNTFATISATAGSNWSISQVSQNDPTAWTVAGVMPNIPGQVTVSVTATTDGHTVTQDFVVMVLDRPATPIIGDITPFQAIVDSTLNATVGILNLGTYPSCSVSITSTAGSGWSILRDAHDATLFHISGNMPAVETTFLLTVSAVNTNANNTISSPATRQLTMRSISVGQQLTIKYPLDLSGSLASNLIKKEQHTLTTNNGRERQMIVPVLAPFYENGLVVRLVSSGLIQRTAQLGVDYLPICEFQQMGKACAGRIYGAIGFLNSSFEGTIEIEYQTLGGDFVLDRNDLYERLATRISNPRQIEWDTVVGLDNYFPVAPHVHTVNSTFVGTSGLISALNTLATGTASLSIESDVTSLLNHAQQSGNPHSVTPSQLSLGNVNNYPPASITQATDPGNHSTYLTPSTASAAGKSNLKTATATVSGISALNLGNSPGDDNNSNDALTTLAILNLMASPTENAIKTAFSGGQVLVQVSPNPPVFPLYWKGVQYRSLDAFIAAVSTFVDISPLQYDQNTSTFIFPQGVTPPSLVTSRTLPNGTSRRRNVGDSVSGPLTIYN